MLQFFLSSSSAWSQFAKQSVVFPKVALTNNCMIISQKKTPHTYTFKFQATDK